MRGVVTAQGADPFDPFSSGSYPYPFAVDVPSVGLGDLKCCIEQLRSPEWVLVHGALAARGASSGFRV